MPVYKAPTRDTLFVLNELLRVGDYSQIPGFEMATPDMIEAVITEGGKFCDEVLAPLTALHVGADWRSRIVTTCAALRDALLSHTDGAELVSASFATGRSAVMTRLVTELAGAAGDAGLPGDHAGLAARTVIYYVLGFTADEQSRLQWDAAGAEIAEEQSPLIDDPGARFAFGLQLLVDGIGAHRLSEMPAAAASRPV